MGQGGGRGARGEGTEGATPWHMKGIGMLVRNFELNHLKETHLGLTRALFDP